MGLVGFVLLAFATALLFLADVTCSGGPVLSEGRTFEAVATLLASLLTALFIIGLLERQDRTILRMGYDSVAAIILYALGLVVLFPFAQ
ncbi:MAG: hypothetical protein ACLGJC_28410 [Alphaproteobacteria bacterium]